MASSNDTNEVSTVQDVLKILPKHEKTLQVNMQDSKNRPSSNSPSYHTLRYGFKPASINSEEPATLELAQDGQVTIKAPNIGGSICTFKGHRRPHVKECLMIIDNRTGEVVLQKLTDNITVKATRSMGGGSGTSGGSGSGGNNNTDNNNTSSNNNGNGLPMSSATSTSSSQTPATASLPTNSATMTNNSSSSTNNHHGHSNHNNHNDNNGTKQSNSKRIDGPQLSEESSDSSDDSSSSSGSSDSSSSSSSNNSSPNNDGFTF